MLKGIISRVVVSWITVFVLTLWCTTRAIQFTKFVARHDVTDSHCVGGDEVFSRYVAGGLADCAARCESPTCLSVFYTEDTGLCQGCSGIYQPTSSLVEASGASCFNKLPCQPPWVTYGNSCYYHPGNTNAVKKTFTDAWNFCQGLDGYLAFIDDQAENDFLKSFLQNHGGDEQHFIGYIRREGSAEFEFYGDSSRAVTYTNFNKKYPQDGVGDQCMLIKRTAGKWTNQNCTRPQSPLCERDPLY